MGKDSKLSPDAMDALRARFQDQSRKAQAYYAVMHEVKSITASEDAASAWMNAPLTALGGKTPADLVSDGREADLLSYIATLKPGSSA